MLSICLLASGGLGLNILKEITKNDHNICAVFTDKNSIEIIQFCQDQNIPFFVGNPRKGKATHFIQNINCEILLSINYLFLVEKDILQLPTRYAINLHGSLLPKYRGRTPHVWAIINGEEKTGVTAHLMDEEVDNGDIVRQIEIPIQPNDTGACILKKFNHHYPILVERILEDIKNNTITLTPQDASKAIYFGKRTPADGKINWEWSRERIRNWVRAQANPYPGAFAFAGDQKMIIHKANLDDFGFHENQPNGTILKCTKQYITVKTPNGALRLENIESSTVMELKTGIILN